ncbi:hypothetical protein GCM10028801_23780 [Nocardioides maradonensis]
MSRLFDGLLDDAALFPPADLDMPEAVVAHLAHRSSAYEALVGSFVVAAQDLEDLAAEVAGLPPRSVRVSVTLPVASVCQVVGATDRIAAVRLGAVEAVPPPARSADMVVGQLRSLLAERPVTAYVEVPRDDRRDDYIAALAGTTMRAKLRTGGVVAELYPSCEELAGSVVALVRAGVPFKATAGLHHAIRNTDPVTGFDQHGFLNLMVATDAALHGAEVPAVADLLAERDPATVAHRARLLDPRLRATFLSFGTCSIADPVEELVALGLLPADHRVIQAALR